MPSSPGCSVAQSAKSFSTYERVDALDLHDVALDRLDQGLGAVGDAEFAEDVRDMDLHRALDHAKVRAEGFLLSHPIMPVLSPYITVIFPLARKSGASDHHCLHP